MQTRLLKDSHKDPQKKQKKPKKPKTGSLKAALAGSPGNTCTPTSIREVWLAWYIWTLIEHMILLILLWTNYVGLGKNIIRYSQTQLDNHNKKHYN